MSMFSHVGQNEDECPFCGHVTRSRSIDAHADDCHVFTLITRRRRWLLARITFWRHAAYTAKAVRWLIPRAVRDLVLGGVYMRTAPAMAELNGLPLLLKGAR